MLMALVPFYAKLLYITFQTQSMYILHTLPQWHCWKVKTQLHPWSGCA